MPGVVSRGYGRLIYLSTGLSRHPRDGMITLGTAKAALDQFVRYVALELAPHGITANLDDQFHETTQLHLCHSIHRMRSFRASHMIRTLEALD